MGLPGRETSTSEPRPLDLGLAYESGDQRFPAQPLYHALRQQLYKNKERNRVPHQCQALGNTPTAGTVSECVRVAEISRPQWLTRQALK